MSNDAPKPPAGWYPTPDGEQRFWDGERWANLPVPPSTAEGHSPPKRGRKALIWGIASLTVVVVAGAGIAGVSWKASIDAENLALAEQTAEEDAIAEQAEKDLQNEQAAAEAEAEEERAEEEAERREREGSDARLGDSLVRQRVRPVPSSWSRIRSASNGPT